MYFIKTKQTKKKKYLKEGMNLISFDDSITQEISQ